MRELLVIIGVVLIALILWDGMRRMQKKGRYSDDYEDPEELRKKAEIARELPNGGARTRPMDDRDKTDLNTRLNLRERVPMLMDPVKNPPMRIPDRSPMSINTVSILMRRWRIYPHPKPCVIRPNHWLTLNSRTLSRSKQMKSTNTKPMNTATIQWPNLTTLLMTPMSR